MRNELREKNLHDTEEPPDAADRRSRPTSIRRARRADDRRHVQRSALSEDGSRRAAASDVTSLSSNVFPDTANLLIPNPRVVSRELMTRDTVQARHDPEPARGVVDSVHGARLVRARASKTDGHRHPAAAGRRLGRAERCACRAACPMPAPAGSTPAARLRQSEQPLVGLRRRSTAPIRHVRRSCGRKIGGKLRIEPTGLLPVDPDTGSLHRLHRQLVDRAGDAPHAVHAGAQLHLRSAGARAPGLERRPALREGAADQLGAHGEDPHRRVDAGHRAAPDHQARR